MSTQVPPIGAVRTGAQEEQRRKKRQPPPGSPAAPSGATADFEALFGEGTVEAAKGLGRSALETGRGVYEGGKAVLGQAVEGIAGGGVDRPAPTGQAKKAEVDATQRAAHDTARQRAPEGQPDNKPVTSPTSSGAAGPTQLAEGTPTDPETGEVDPTQFGQYGSVFVHRGRGPDPATQPGGFAHPSAQRDPLEDLPEHGRVARGPEGATGGHSWTLRTPGRQEAMYDRARYQREVQARQAGEDAAIGELDARAAAALADVSRSRELEKDPFAPEKAEVAAAVGEQVAKARPEREAMELAMGLADQMQERIATINEDPDLTPEERAQRIQEAKEMFWSYLAGIRPRARKPREEFPMLPPEGEEA